MSDRSGLDGWVRLERGNRARESCDRKPDAAQSNLGLQFCRHACRGGCRVRPCRPGISRRRAAQRPADCRGAKAGSEITTELIQQIHAMGLPATNASATSRPQTSDLVIEGSLLSIQQGSAAERVNIGLTAGEFELKAAVEVYQ